MELNPYISFDGACAEAFAFYADVLDGEIEFKMTYGESPMAGDTPAEQHGRVLHASLRFGERRLLGADAPPAYFSKPQGFCVSISFEDTDKAKAIFEALSPGGTVQMPFGPTFWSKGFGMLIDRFGIPWMVSGAMEEMGVMNVANLGDERLGAAFVLEREFDAPRALVFTAFTEPRHLGRWWGPKEANVVAQDMDLRPGGRYHYCMRGDGFEMWGRFIWREITPPERLVFVNSFSDAAGGLTRHPMSPDWPLEMLSTITFADAPGGGTRVRIEWRPLNASDAEQAVFDAGHDSMRQGWGGSLDRLAGYLAEQRAAGG